MDEQTRKKLDNIYSSDGEAQNKAYTDLMAETEKPVAWAYEAWAELLNALKHKDNRVRSITSQLLCNLAKSDPENRMLKDFDKLLLVTKDERFVTARHCLQALWKVGLAGNAQRQCVMDGLSGRYIECSVEKNGTLIRYDILQGMRNLYDQTGDESIREKALALIALEQDAKYQKKYSTLWKAGKK